jgi:hypothetical protein
MLKHKLFVVAGTQVYTVLWKRQFAYPIYRITHLDLNRDGLDELIVSTMYGVHIFQVLYTCYYAQLLLKTKY